MKIFKTLGLLFGLFFINGYAFGQNLVINGDFESGNSGFTSTYAHAPGGNGGASEYTVATNPAAWNGAFASFVDHTSGAGNMMIVNGGLTSAVWEQTIPVTPNTNYDFAAYLAGAYPVSPAELEFSVNGTSIGNLNATSTTGVWDLFFSTWNSGAATSATIQIVNTNTAAGGNDFALDDIYFGPTIFSGLPPAVPTLSEWTLFLFALIVFTVALVAGYNVKQWKQEMR